MAQLARCSPNIRAHRVCHEGLGLFAERRGQQGLHGGPDPIDNGPQTRRLVKRGLAEFLQGGRDRAAFRVPEHDHQPRAEACGRELHAADLRRRHDIPSYPDDEQVAKSLSEDELGGNAGVRASEDNGEGLLTFGERRATRLAASGSGVSDARDKLPVALLQTPERFIGWHHLYALTRICSVAYTKKMESVFAIIAEPNRRAILGLLVSSQQSVGEIERRLRMPQPTVSKHLRVLREAGFVESTVAAQRRLYRLKPEPLQEVAAWLAPFRRFWSAHVDALERHLDRVDQSTLTKRKTRRRR